MADATAGDLANFSDSLAVIAVPPVNAMLLGALNCGAKGSMASPTVPILRKVVPVPAAKLADWLESEAAFSDCVTDVIAVKGGEELPLSSPHPAHISPKPRNSIGTERTAFIPFVMFITPLLICFFLLLFNQTTRTRESRFTSFRLKMYCTLHAPACMSKLA
jgi:hypothetical protein